MTIEGLSHITFVVRSLDRMEEILSAVLDATKIYDSGDDTYSMSRERFFKFDNLPFWIAIMEGEGLPAPTYNHVALKIPEADYDKYLARIQSLGLKIREGRSRIEGEGRSIYFEDEDNHLFELHTGTLEQRLRAYEISRPKD